MSKNYMGDVAKMLGVKLGEPFPLVCSYEKYKLLESGMWVLDKDGDWVRADPCIFLNLIRGDTVIVDKTNTPIVAKPNTQEYYGLAEGPNFTFRVFCTITNAEKRQD